MSSGVLAIQSHETEHIAASVGCSFVVKSVFVQLVPHEIFLIGPCTDGKLVLHVIGNRLTIGVIVRFSNFLQTSTAPQ